MERSTNALAELAESMKRKIGDFSSDESFMANLATLENANSPEDQKAATFFREYALASRIVAELAKVSSGRWENICDGPPAYICDANDLKIGCCIGNCRAIAEEGAGGGIKSS